MTRSRAVFVPLGNDLSLIRKDETKGNHGPAPFSGLHAKEMTWEWNPANPSISNALALPVLGFGERRGAGDDG